MFLPILKGIDLHLSDMQDEFRFCLAYLHSYQPAIVLVKMIGLTLMLGLPLA